MSTLQSQAYAQLMERLKGYGQQGMRFLTAPAHAFLPGANEYMNTHPEQMTNLAVGMVSPGEELLPEGGAHPVEGAHEMFERMFNRENGGEYDKAKALAEWETGHPEGVQSPEHRAEVTKEWNRTAKMK